MNQELRKINFIQAALKQRGATVDQIHAFIDKLKQLVKTPEAFDQWNEILDAKGIKVLSLMLTPQGSILCYAVLDGLFTSLTQHYRITRSELEAMVKFN